MNHLAHSFLSFPNPQVLLGNFIGDFVKGRAWEAYPPEIRKGILLHRSIDAFTDAHPAVRESVRRLRPLAGRYSGPLTDVLYDHLLVRHWETMTEVGFEEYATWVYASLEEQHHLMPDALQERWPRMRDVRFLHGYVDESGLRLVLERFSRRLPGRFDPAAVHDFFFEEIEAFSADFSVFFPEIQKRMEGMDHSARST